MAARSRRERGAECACAVCVCACAYRHTGIPVVRHSMAAMGRSGGWRWWMRMMGSAGQEDRRRDHLRGAGGTQREQAISYGSWYGQRRSRPSRPPAPTNNEPHERRSETGKSPDRREHANAKVSQEGASESATPPRLLKAPPSLDRHQCDERRRGTVLLRCSSFTLRQRVHKCHFRRSPFTSTPPPNPNRS